MYRKLPTILSIVAAAAAFCLLGAATVHAQSVRTGHNLTVPSAQTVDGSYYAAGRSIDIAGTVNGDVYCGTQTLTISGTVHGDVICGAQTVTITGKVDGSIRVAGQQITLGGQVGRNVSVAGQELHMGGGSGVGGDLTFVGSSLDADGTVGRDVVATAQTITVSGAVGRNMAANVQQLTFADGANVSGTVHYTSQQKADVQNGAHAGTLVYSQSQPKQPKHEAKHVLAWFLLWYAAAVLFSSIVLILLVPRLFRKISDEIITRPWWTVLIGFLVAVALPAITVIAFLTLIGIPLAVLLLLLGFIATLLCFPVSAFTLGRVLYGRWLGWSNNAIVIMLLGIVSLIILLFIPLVNIIVWLFVVWVGFGGMARALRHTVLRPEYTLPAHSSK
jgi:cytoskeletal protein CcmA (bactofilin family)